MQTQKSSSKTNTAANTFGEWLKTERTKRGLDQKDLVALGGTKIATVSQFETGRRKPTAMFILKIAKAFNLSPEETFQRFAEVGLWDGPLMVDKSADAKLIAEFKRIIRGKPDRAVESALLGFEQVVNAEARNLARYAKE